MRLSHLHITPHILLAPMAGVTDHPFRFLCRRFGAGLAYTEFVSANGVVRENARTLDLVRFTPDERPIGIQVFGEEPETIARSAAFLAEQFQPDLIDLNFGCPVPKVTRKGAGGAMLRDLGLMRETVQATVQAVPQLPVTVKLRAGWDKTGIVALEAADIIEEAGAAAITLHPRTIRQGYSGQADWSLIQAVKDRVSIPVIGNGDIFVAADALRMLETTGCDAVMVARGALGSPWIFRQIIDLLDGKPAMPVTVRDIAQVACEHFRLMRAEKSERGALNYTKKHFSWYFKGFAGAAGWRKAFMESRSTARIAALLDEFSAFAGSSGEGLPVVAGEISAIVA